LFLPNTEVLRKVHTGVRLRARTTIGWPW